MTNCEYISKCPYERKKDDFVCQNNEHPQNCVKYQGFKKEEIKLEKILMLKTDKN